MAGMSRRRCPRLSVVLHAVAVVAVPLALLQVDGSPTPTAADRGPAALQSPVTATPPSAPAADRADLRALSGIWSRYEPGPQGERLRFYYFHGDGTGLYRYGRVGLNHTHSFDYDVRGDRLVLDFRKTGDHHEVKFALRPGEGQGKRDWLELTDDPREPEPRSARYFRESAEPVRTTAQPATASSGPAPAGHMWIDLRHYATGGQGFAFYQFRPAGIDGRGVGWFHRGDFDDWSTEWLTYRVTGDRLELTFSLAETTETTTFTVHTEDDRRWLTLDDDPRDFWHTHRYLDMGPSFGAALAPFEVGEGVR